MALSAAQYHRETSYSRSDMKGHGLDWANQPTVFKNYSGLPTIALPDVPPRSGQSLSDVIKQKALPRSTSPMDLNCLACILDLTHAVTAKARHGGGYFYYRNAASAGALYPFEIYVGVTGVGGLDDGLYHHTIAGNALTRLRSGDITNSLTEGLFGSIHYAAATFFFTSIFFRSAWKYRERAYRYHLLDTGHLIENGVLASLAQGVPFELMYDFDDDKINALLGVDPKREVCLAAATMPQRIESAIREPVGLLGPLFPGCAEASRVSSYEEDMTLIQSMHAASSSVTRPVQTGADQLLPEMGPNKRTGVFSKQEAIWPEKMNYPQAVQHRRSKRNFVRRALSSSAFQAIVDLLCFQAPSGRYDNPWAVREVVSVGFLCNHVEERAAGFYFLDPKKKTFSPVVDGFMAEQMAHICLDQAWLANSALHVLFLSHLEAIEGRWGPRGYRYAMLNAGRLGQRLYLAATAMGLGCCGIGAFYDDEASTLLGTGAMKLLYLVAVGPVKGLS